ncbi:hypothetical protein Fmac_005548 [Flemingia macrophylla]|uniref:Uncharacterized protein n=1 Tax=Flemingia macrophylla TaxID=520843 RepID=A0ABD1N834_9FABA
MSASVSDMRNIQVIIGRSKVVVGRIEMTKKSEHHYWTKSKVEKYMPSRLSDGISVFEYEQMRDLVSNLSQENKTLKDHIKSCIRSSKEESRLLRE